MTSTQIPKKLADVFKTVGLPPYTYVKPSHFGEVRSDIEQPGKHLLIEGPSGIGKTCIVYKVFEEMQKSNPEDYEYISGRDADAEARLDSFLERANSGARVEPNIFVVDDFHMFPQGKRSEVGAQMKRLSDRIFEQQNPAKLILIGIPTTGNSLLSDAYDLGPRLGTYRFERASDTEINKLINEGELALNVLFEDRSILLSESSGNFWLAQHICNKICATQDVHQTQTDVRILSFDLLGIRRRLMLELSQRYLPIARSFAKGKKWRPGGNKPYLDVLLAISKIPDLVIPYDRILNVVPERRRPGLRAIRPRISEVIYNPAKEIDLRKQIGFEDESSFSIEDPLFRYYLSNVDPAEIYRDLGIEDNRLEESSMFAYELGFSFAGEARQIVESINNQFKNEDVITFYDYDLQSVLLALDLEMVLKKIYANSCRYYLVFLDSNYQSKVWTKYEKDIMTSSGRMGHIIPVILDDEGANGAVGIPSTIARIDLREAWASAKQHGNLDREALNAIRNRCVLPILGKLSTTDNREDLTQPSNA